MSREYPCVYFDDKKCRKDPPEENYVDWCVMGPCPYETPSNGDRVRVMCDGELAELFAAKVIGQVALMAVEAARPISGVSLAAMKYTYRQLFFSWLRSPAEEGTT